MQPPTAPGAWLPLCLLLLLAVEASFEPPRDTARPDGTADSSNSRFDVSIERSSVADGQVQSVPAHSSTSFDRQQIPAGGFVNGYNSVQGRAPDPPRQQSGNMTRHHIQTAVVDGDLGTGRSAASYARRPIPFVNGHNHVQSEVPDWQVRQVNITDVAQDVVQNGGHAEPEVTGPASSGADDADSGKQHVLETQQTTCQVTTELLAASAQATVTRVLQGLCTSRKYPATVTRVLEALCTSQDMEVHFSNLVSVLTGRLDELKAVLMSVEGRVEDYNAVLKQGKYQQLETLVQHCDPPKPRPAAAIREPDYPARQLGARDSEIQKYNSTIHLEPSMAGPQKRVFTYYWRIAQVHQKLNDWIPTQTIRSQSFFITPGGYRMYLRSYPRHNEHNFQVQVGLTKGEFDQALKWPFALKIRVAILDQSREARMFEDLTSRLWDPTQLCSEFNWRRPVQGDNYECVGLSFPHDLLLQRGYLDNDTLVIKLTVYLEF